MPHVNQRVYTVGRLDEDSEGLLLLTNDGDLANRLMHPRYGVEKTYLVQVAGTPNSEDIQKLLKGVWLSDGHVRARSVRRLKRQGDSTWLQVTLSEGKNREIRRMLARLGHKVMRLRRIAIGPIQLGRLAVGKSRPLGARRAARAQAARRKQAGCSKQPGCWPESRAPMNLAPPPCFLQTTAPVVANRRLARDTYLIRLEAADLARRIRPGQFVMLRLATASDPLLGRPFALYDTYLDAHGEPAGIDVVYLVVGKLTRRLAALRPGDALQTWGPLGNGFPDPVGDDHVGLVAGGIGQTPFLAHSRELLGTRGYGGQPARRRVHRVSLYYGVRTAELAAGVDDFRAAGATVRVATDDGSLGFRGLVTQLLQQHEPPQHLFGCGPEPMLHALAHLARERGTPCHLSLETPMACGVGICFSCVTRVKTADGWDYRRVCVEGPVFDAAELAL